MKKLMAIILSMLMVISVLTACGAEEIPEEQLPPEEPQEAPEKVDYNKIRKLAIYPGSEIKSPEGMDYFAKEHIPEGKEMGYSMPGGSEVLYVLGRCGEFGSIGEISYETLISAAMKSVECVDVSKKHEELRPIADAIGTERFWPKEWVTCAAREVFGDVTIHHRSVEAEGIVYHQETGVYYFEKEPETCTVIHIVNHETEGDFLSCDFFYVTKLENGEYQIGDGDLFLSEEEFKVGLHNPEYKEFVESGKDQYHANFRRNENGTYSIIDLIKNCVEPELIREHIAALNEVVTENFAAEFDTFGRYGTLLFDEIPTDYIESKPVAITFEDVDYNGNPPMHNGLYVDFFERTCHEVKNFKSKAEIREYLSKWLDESVMGGKGYSDIDYNFVELDGKLYKTFGNRGYGMSYYGDSVITQQTETEMTAIAKDYRIIKSEHGEAEIRFEKRGGNWIIVSVKEI